MNNYELYRTLSKQIGTTRTVYFRDAIGTYGRAREVYVPARIMEFKFNDTTDTLKVTLMLARLFGSSYESPKFNVSVADIFLPSPINSRFHGDMIPVRTYFEMMEAEQGSNDIRFNSSVDVGAYYPKDLKAAIERNSVRQMSFGFYKPITKADFDYNKIIFSGPCTIIIWKDGTKTMARVSEGDTFDPEKGVAICFMKRILGHTETNKTLKIADEMWELLNTACADMTAEANK